MIHRQDVDNDAVRSGADGTPALGTAVPGTFVTQEFREDCARFLADVRRRAGASAPCTVTGQAQGAAHERSLLSS